jgi:hypothetical protein
MSKISLFTELTTGNIADGDLIPLVDITASATRKVLASSLYAYHLAKLDTATRLVPTLTTSADFLDGSGAFSVPPDTTYSTMAAGNSYVAGLTPAGSATHDAQYLRKDGTWASQYELMSTPLTTSRPQISIAKSSGGSQTDGTFSFAATQYMDVVITKQQHDTSSGQDVVTVDFSASSSVVLTGHTTGSTFHFDLSVDLSSFAIDNSSASVNPNYFPVTVYYNKNHFACLANLNTSALELPDVDVGITGDGTFAIIFAGQIRYYIN